MSHFTVLVCLPGDTPRDDHGLRAVLDRVMAPWDENVDVPAYRTYQDGGPEDHWFVGSCRTLARGVGMTDDEILASYREREPEFTVRATLGDPTRRDEMIAKHRDSTQRAAESEVRLGEHPDWPTVVRVYNAHYDHLVEGETAEDSRLTYHEDDDPERLYHDEESGRAYSMITYNPNSKWDWWTIGGRWRGRLIARPGVDPDRLIHGESGLSDGVNAGKPRHCDGGVLADLDLDAMRDREGERAGERWDTWRTLVDGSQPDTPLLPWSSFTARVDAGQLTIEVARLEYGAQPAIQAAKVTKFYHFMDDDPVETYGVPRDEHVARARAGAVPGYAFVNLDGDWVAPGEMGWFGVSSDTNGSREAYEVEVNRYLERLPEDTCLVGLDCHI